jgi:proteic killer suppression protein
MILTFADEESEDIFDGRSTKRTRRRLPQDLLDVALRKLDYLNTARDLNDLRIPRGNRLEPLHGNREGQHSIRINDQYRICFVWTPAGPEQVEIVDYH